MAEEDIIFGKNRHFFGGIEPSNMITFSAKSDYQTETDTLTVKINAKLPDDTVIEGQTLCTVAGAIIRKSTTDYPKDEFSGDMVAAITEDQEIIDSTVVDGTTYYYAAFPYSTQGVYNRNKSNRIEVTPKLAPVPETYIFGYDLDKNISDPDARVSYPSDVDNADFSPAFMDFDADTFNYGGWPSEGMFMPRPCMIKYDGTVAEYLDPNDYTKTTDNTESQVANPDFEGNAMMEWPKIYTKRWTENGIYHFRCSNTPVDDGYDCWSNYDKNDNQIEHFYTAIYFGSNISEEKPDGTYIYRTRSISGQSNAVNQNSTHHYSNAQSNGDGWNLEFLADRLLIQDLLVMMSKSTNSQEKYGSGRCAPSNQSVVPQSAIGQGTMDSKGLFWGSNNPEFGVKVFGMEHLWSNLWRKIAGWGAYKGFHYIKITWGTHDGSTTSDFNENSTGYIHLKEEPKTPNTLGGYISGTIDLNFGRLPCITEGSSTTNECDGLWSNDGGTYGLQAAVGGSYKNWYHNGIFCAMLTLNGNTQTVDVGSAISFKPINKGEINET